jgi:hypothetical protein
MRWKATPKTVAFMEEWNDALVRQEPGWDVLGGLLLDEKWYVKSSFAAHFCREKREPVHFQSCLEGKVC